MDKHLTKTTQENMLIHAYPLICVCSGLPRSLGARSKRAQAKAVGAALHCCVGCCSLRMQRVREDRLMHDRRCHDMRLMPTTANWLCKRHAEGPCFTWCSH